MKYKTYYYPKEIQLEQLLGVSDDCYSGDGEQYSLEYKNGLFNEMDMSDIGIKYDIERAIKTGLFTVKERDVIQKILYVDAQLDAVQRKLKERAAKKLSKLLK